jgi:hypothetical protein
MKLHASKDGGIGERRPEVIALNALYYYVSTVGSKHFQIFIMRDHTVHCKSSIQFHDAIEVVVSNICSF